MQLFVTECDLCKTRDEKTASRNLYPMQPHAWLTFYEGSHENMTIRKEPVDVCGECVLKLKQMLAVKKGN